MSDGHNFLQSLIKKSCTDFPCVFGSGSRVAHRVEIDSKTHTNPIQPKHEGEKPPNFHTVPLRPQRCQAVFNREGGEVPGGKGKAERTELLEGGAEVGDGRRASLEVRGQRGEMVEGPQAPARLDPRWTGEPRCLRGKTGFKIKSEGLW